MEYKNIILTRTNLGISDVDVRLINVVNSYIGFFSSEISKTIYRIHDHKGDLTVTWKTEPSEIQKRIIELAWENEGESSSNVVHEIQGS